ncbi:hypothetical protein LTR84_004416 [Exophiala bonariae]|uniref:Nucleoside phosphorylase domain-containing protein n=1 Tax=Exophiala bonariae TaxID=1690606 RepID=A0AAV9N4M1_9EURO|nr:hypothetical protein LTR84_004416 [Exophiala bonariae]
MSPLPPQDRSGFEVAIICALPLEANLVQSTFDIFWEDEGYNYAKAPGDPNIYTPGVISGHNVVLARLPNMGKVDAASVAASMRISFAGVKLALLVGICGAVPRRPDSNEDIFLGDVILSQTIIQYDFRKQYPMSEKRISTVEDSHGRPSQEIRSILARMRESRYRKKTEANINTYLTELQRTVKDTISPGPGLDLLYEASRLHKHHNLTTSNLCVVCAEDEQSRCPESILLNCDELGCKQMGVAVRKRQEGPSNTQSAVSIHIGRIGSADVVMKSGWDRDRIAQEDNIIGFEMEGAGVWDHFPSVVIKGVCDYADSHKNKRWQCYAAAAAAACARSFLQEWNAEIVTPATPAQDYSIPPQWYVPFLQSQLQSFIGRKNEIEKLEAKLFGSDSAKVVAALGLGGVGKSRIALDLAYRTKVQRPRHSVFWVEATNNLTFERDYFAIGKLLKIPGIDENQADIKLVVKRYLSLPIAGKWFLIIDNADDEDNWGVSASESEEQMNLGDYLPESPSGPILVTTRSRHIASTLAGRNVVELQEMSINEAEATFRSLLEKPEILVNSQETQELLQRLTFLPLAIVQAASYLNKNDESISVYLELLKQPEDNVVDLLSEDFVDKGRYKGAKNPVATTWLISFNNIRARNPLAAEYLSFMSCLNEQNIPQSLLPLAPSVKDMVDAIGILRGYSFLRKTDDRSSFGALYNMHRLVRLATRNWLRHEDLLGSWTANAIRRVAQIFPNYDALRPDIVHEQWSLYMPHAQTLTGSGLVDDLEERYDLLAKTSVCLLESGKYGEAAEIHLLIVRRMECKSTTGTVKKATAYHDFADALNEISQWTEAEKYLRQALEWRQEMLGVDHVDTLRSMTLLVEILNELDRVQAAFTLGQEVVSRSQKVLGQNHPYTLEAMGHHAMSLSLQGKHEEGSSIYAEVLERQQKLLGREHRDTLSAMNNLSLVLARQGKHHAAETLEAEVLETRKRIFGLEHPSTLLSMHNLAITLHRQGRNQEAIALMRECVHLRETTLGVEHEYTKVSKEGLRRWQEAEQQEEEEDKKKKQAHPQSGSLQSPGLLATTFPTPTAAHAAKRGDEARSSSVSVSNEPEHARLHQQASTQRSTKSGFLGKLALRLRT